MSLHGDVTVLKADCGSFSEGLSIMHWLYYLPALPDDVYVTTNCRTDPHNMSYICNMLSVSNRLLKRRLVSHGAVCSVV